MSDDLKPVRCGCGGEVAVLWNEYYRVKCWKCGTQTKRSKTEADAITAWNCAMGANMQDCAKDARTAKVMNDGVNYCENCEGYVEAPMAYCPYCGARLEWK